MTRYLCPDCEGGGMLLLEDGLTCSFCGGSYVWRKKVDQLKEEGVKLGEAYVKGLEDGKKHFETQKE